MGTSGKRRIMKFGEMAVEDKLITPEQLAEALRRQETSMKHLFIGEVLVRMGAMDEAKIILLLSDQWDYEIVDLDSMEISYEITKLVEQSISTLYRIVPIGLEDGKLILAASPKTVWSSRIGTHQYSNLTKLLKYPFEFRLASPDSVGRKISCLFALESPPPFISLPVELDYPEVFFGIKYDNPEARIDELEKKVAEMNQELVRLKDELEKFKYQTNTRLLNGGCVLD